MTHFLIQQAEGRNVLRAYLHQLAVQRCQPVDHLALLGALYPGGLPVLEADWQRWLLAASPEALQF